jgi:NAD(P)H-dependent FMN reductase
MNDRILVLYGSYRSDRTGIRLANYIVHGLIDRGNDARLLDAREIGLPMLDRMYKEYAPDEAPQAMEDLAEQIRSADAFVFVAGEYNWGVQPGLKNLTDHFLEEWFWRPAPVASYSAGRLSGVRANLAWHGTLSEMGMVVIPSTVAVGPIAKTLDENGDLSARPAARLTARSHASPATWPGGQPPQRISERRRRRLTDVADHRYPRSMVWSLPSELCRGQLRLLSRSDSKDVAPFGVLFVAGSDIGADRDDLEPARPRIGDKVFDHCCRDAGAFKRIGCARVVGTDQIRAAMGEGDLAFRIDPGNLADISAMAFAILQRDGDFGLFLRHNRAPRERE